MGTGQELYNRAKQIIPGGTQLLSKRPEMFLPELWPTYYSKADGCEIWDLDNNHFVDMSYMGIGACVLGYANRKVDTAAKEMIDRGQMATLNVPEEVELAQKMLDLHPWAGGVRYAKAGGEALALAIRIARASTGKDTILFCGYHGWHDWYLAANLTRDDSLDEHLLAGLEPVGVPGGLAGTMIPFHYNDADEFNQAVRENSGKIAAIIMEPIRNDYPNEGFLEKVREIATQEDCVLIFDEVTAGFRISVGGSHLALGVNPDMAVFGKALANGYPIAAVIGTKTVMNAAQSSFISSTFHTEGIGFAAALACIMEFERHDTPKVLSQLGKVVKAGWVSAAAGSGLEVIVGGIDPLAHFSFVSDEPLIEKTYFTQEMLKCGYLATTAYYASASHTETIIANYLKNTQRVFAQIAQCRQVGESLRNKLEGPVCHSGFQRLN